MTLLRISPLLLLLLFTTAANQAQEIHDGNGLEVNEPIGIFVLVEQLSNDAQEIGLYRNRIKDKIELRLQQADLEVISKRENIDDNYDYYLYANIQVVGNAFKIRLEFKRTVYYSTSDKLYSTIGTSWDDAGSGTHGGDSEYIIDSLEPMIDSFINNFLKAN